MCTCARRYYGARRSSRIALGLLHARKHLVENMSTHRHSQRTALHPTNYTPCDLTGHHSRGHFAESDRWSIRHFNEARGRLSCMRGIDGSAASGMPPVGRAVAAKVPHVVHLADARAKLDGMPVPLRCPAQPHAPRHIRCHAV